mmetsp:Transcript_35971/g.90848  ORF Transcript_35971/g.90848 Transcript_35971/m.90848 type:complete len:290 (-) Transcript_35971:460-1329(-)
MSCSRGQLKSHLFVAVLLHIWGFSKSRLTHVVMPFNTHQLNRVEANLEHWKAHNPCHTGCGLFDLVFFVAHNGTLDTWVETKLKTFIARLPSTVMACFSSVHVEHILLAGEGFKHLIATRTMFEMVIKRELSSLETAACMLYMEPDLRPVRSNWLCLLDADASCNEFIIRGSIFFGRSFDSVKKFNFMAYHVNGNAMYCVNDGRLRQLYFDHVRPYIDRTVGLNMSAYDIDFWTYLFALDNFIVARRFIHLYQRTDRIINMCYTKYHVVHTLIRHPNAVLIHGGHPYLD